MPDPDNHADPTPGARDFPNKEIPPLFSHRHLLAYLHSHGHFHGYDDDHFIVEEIPWTHVQHLPPEHPDVAKAITSWQTFRPDLKPDGIFGPLSHARAAREVPARCGLPDILPRAAAVPRWPDDCKHNLTTSHDLASLAYTPSANQSIDAAWDRGLQLWMGAADLSLTRLTAGGSARIHAHAERLGRYILAWSELATGSCASRLRQAYNSQLTWNWHLLWSTICHEIGHAIGIAHGGRGIMQPAHDPSVHELGSWDINQVVKRYGQAEPLPPPLPPPAQRFTWALLELFDDDDVLVDAFTIKREAPA